MVDVVCSEKSDIVCQKSFHYNEMDLEDLPNNQNFMQYENDFFVKIKLSKFQK